MNNTPPLHARFIIRRGSTDWMVYDRERRGPAQLEKGGRFAEKLTVEQAEHIKQALADSLVMQVRARSVSQLPTSTGKPRP
ncbi:hypothetical protein [Bradyrhizobium erythrophlei]|nr:hypothetical protein [Bradyrhizobium erythrophlei]